MMTGTCASSSSHHRSGAHFTGRRRMAFMGSDPASSIIPRLAVGTTRKPMYITAYQHSINPMPPKISTSRSLTQTRLSSVGGLTETELIGRLMMATISGAAIGFERR